MKKFLLFISIIVLGISCKKDFFVYDKIDSVVYFLNAGENQLKLSTKTADVVVVKGGYVKDSPVVSVRIDESIVSGYNEKYGSDYKLMPSSAFTFAGGETAVDKDSCTAHFPVEFNLDNLESGLWMLPIRLGCKDVSVNEAKSTVMFTIEIR